MPAKVSFTPKKKKSQMLYNDFKMGYNTCFDHDNFQILLSFFNVQFSTVWKTVFLSLSTDVKQNQIMRQSHELSSELLFATINKIRMTFYHYYLVLFFSCACSIILSCFVFCFGHLLK